MSPDLINKAWNRGYRNEPCSYDTPALVGAWLNGQAARLADEAARRRK